MENYHIYLSGGMSGISFEEQTKWRNRFRDAIKFGDYEINKNVCYFSPPDYYNFDKKQHKSEREIFEFDLNALRKSDLVVVNFNAPQSIGTAMELMLANELRIPIVGLNANNIELHPWLECCCTRICDNFRELVEHVVEFYLK
jgi:nucleoside 2-deoxyribosyltransferase